MRPAAVLPSVDLPTTLGFAFQPYVDLSRQRVVGHEALVRGPGGLSAAEVFGLVAADDMHDFDTQLRGLALREGKRLGIDRLGQQLNLNILPNAIGNQGELLLGTLEIARDIGFPGEALVLEIIEVERVQDPVNLRALLRDMSSFGFRTAIDDLGAGWSSLLLLAEFQPDFVKLDRALVQGIDQDPRRRSVVRGIKRACDEMGCAVIAEGVEMPAESRVLRDLGLFLQQGYLFAHPRLHELHPDIDFGLTSA